MKMEFYGVPADHNRIVRWVDQKDKGPRGRITSIKGQYVMVRWEGTKRSVAIHPLDLDYLVDGEWQLGKDFLAKVNARIDRFNEWLIRGLF